MINRLMEADAELAMTPGGGHASLPSEHAQVKDGTVIIPDSDVPKDARVTVVKLIDTAFSAYYGKGGVLFHEQEAKAGKERISEMCFDVIKMAVQTAGNNLVYARAWAVAYFKVAEDHIRAKDKELRGKSGEGKPSDDLRPLGQILPPWATNKSKFLKALAAGIDPNARRPADEGGSLLYPSAPKYAEAASKKGADEKETSKNGKSESPSVATLRKETDRKPFDRKLEAALTVLFTTLGGLTVAQQQMAAADVAACAKRIADRTAAQAANPPVEKPLSDSPVVSAAADKLARRERKLRGGSK